MDTIGWALNTYSYIVHLEISYKSQIEVLCDWLRKNSWHDLVQ